MLSSAMMHFEYDTLRCQSPECAASCKTALTISTPSLPTAKKAWCEEPPGFRDGAVGKLYLAYLRDPDGNKICALHRPAK